MHRHSSSAAGNKPTPNEPPVPVTESVIKAAISLQSQDAKDAVSLDPSQGSAGMVLVIADGLLDYESEETDKP